MAARRATALAQSPGSAKTPPSRLPDRLSQPLREFSSTLACVSRSFAGPWCSLVFCSSLVISLVAQSVKSLPAMWEAWVGSVGRQDSLEKERTTHCSILAWRIPWTGEPGGPQSMGLQRVGHD